MPQGDTDNVVIFQYFKAQKEEVFNVLRGLPKMMEVELAVDTDKFFTYEAVARAAGGIWDPIARTYKDEEALYAKGVADDMIADVPG